MQNFRLIQFEKLEEDPLNNPLCIVGMPGIADIGKFAVDQLIGVLKAKKYCDIIFNDYPAGAIVENSILSTPKAEILYYKDPKSIRDIVLVTADAQAMSPRGIYEISDYITSILYNLGIKKIVSLGAYPIQKGEREDSCDKKVFVSTTHQDRIEKFLKNPEMEKLNKGVIIGSNGLIPTLAKARFNIEGAVLLAETDKSAVLNDNFTDLEASIYLLDLIGKHFHLPIESSFNRKEVGKISKSLEDKRKKLEEQLESVQPHLEIGDNDKSLYI